MKRLLPIALIVAGCYSGRMTDSQLEKKAAELEASNTQMMISRAQYEDSKFEMAEESITRGTYAIKNSLTDIAEESFKLAAEIMNGCDCELEQKKYLLLAMSYIGLAGTYETRGELVKSGEYKSLAKQMIAKLKGHAR